MEDIVDRGAVYIESRGPEPRFWNEQALRF